MSPAAIIPHRPIFVIGDIHGYYDKLAELLQQTGLIGADQNWRGADARLWFLGDFCDRGPDGIGVIELVMRLQTQAAMAGGQVSALLGNHDLLLLAVKAMDNEPMDSDGVTFGEEWRRNGGRQSDLDRLGDRHMAWLQQLPVMAKIGDWLLLHADSLLYLRHGQTVAAVNRSFSAILQSNDVAAWGAMLTPFATRRAFGAQNSSVLDGFLHTFDVQGLVHGHTPISTVTGEAPGAVTAPHVYAGGRCINVDGGMYLGGPGFALSLRYPRPVRS